MIRGDQVAPFDWHRAVLDMLGEQVVVQLDELEVRRGAEVVLNIQEARLLPHATPINLELRSDEVTGVVCLLGFVKNELDAGILGDKSFQDGKMKIFRKH